nr:hypothetical protein [Rhodoferax sp.]
MQQNFAELNRALCVAPSAICHSRLPSIARNIVVRPLLLAGLLAVMGLFLLRHICTNRLTTGHWWP